MGWRKHVYLSLFSFAKSENKRAEQVRSRREGWHQWEEERERKENRRINTV
jgi:hypothetical protein